MSFAKDEFKFSYLIVVAETDKLKRMGERERASDNVCHPTIVKTKGEIIPKSIFRKAHNAVIAFSGECGVFCFLLFAETATE